MCPAFEFTHIQFQSMARDSIMNINITAALSVVASPERPGTRARSPLIANLSYQGTSQNGMGRPRQAHGENTARLRDKKN